VWHENFWAYGVPKVWRQPNRELTADLVERKFVVTRPNQLWVVDLTYIATWRVSTPMKAALVLDALEQVIHARSTPRA
jgi:transposase InsO family protein